jgi:hypothetical protein
MWWREAVREGLADQWASVVLALPALVALVLWWVMR